MQHLFLPQQPPSCADPIQSCLVQKTRTATQTDAKSIPADVGQFIILYLLFSLYLFICSVLSPGFSLLLMWVTVLRSNQEEKGGGICINTHAELYTALSSTCSNNMLSFTCCCGQKPMPFVCKDVRTQKTHACCWKDELVKLPVNSRVKSVVQNYN